MCEMLHESFKGSSGLVDARGTPWIELIGGPTDFDLEGEIGPTKVSQVDSDWQLMTLMSYMGRVELSFKVSSGEFGMRIGEVG